MKKSDTYQEILTLKELCMYLRISEKTALKLIKEGTFKNAFKIRNAWRIPKENVIEFMKRS